MLSNQVRTNHTGIHRRQRSTPALPTLTQSIHVPIAARQHECHSRISPTRIEQFLALADNAQEGYHEKQAGERQQCKENSLQETQQAGARSGAFVIQSSDSIRQVERCPKPSRKPLPDHETISHEDFNALLLGLQPREDPGVQQVEDRSEGFVQTKGGHHVAGSRSIAPSDGSPCRPFSEHDLRGNVVDFSPTASIFPAVNDERERPQTPLDQIFASHPTKTPSTMPVHRQSMKEEPNLTVQASLAMQRSRSFQENFATTNRQSVKLEPLSPALTAPLSRNSIDIELLQSPAFPSLSDLKKEMPHGHGGYDPAIYSPLTAIDPLASPSLQPPLNGTKMSLFESPEVDNAVFDAQLSFIQATQGSWHLSGESSPTHSAGHSRNQSVNDVDVEDCIQETGVTADEIASFIQGPLPEDQKWACLFEDNYGKPCGKRFARKENAKSHVQTHLGDRQYVCNVCHTRFVRQHDLKRHYRIHTTEKSFRCPCGKDFHRQDALTRHRQRGMCVGALDGSPKKNAKRGRPKKARPNNTERSEKAAKTRQYVLERTKPGSTYASSISGSSEYSHPSPPVFDNISVPASSPSMSHQGFEVFSFTHPCSAPLTPPGSPERSPGKICTSPFSQHSFTPKPSSRSVSPKMTSIPEDKQMAEGCEHLNYIGDHSSPPELDPSSSSPATSNIVEFHGYSDINSSSQQKVPRLNYLNPQVLSGDFQLFESASDGSPGGIQFEDFIDFGNEELGTDKQGERGFLSGQVLDAGSYTIAPPSDLDDPFVQL